MGRKSKALGYGVRRPLLEYVVRRRVAALPNVEIVRGHGEGLVAGTDRRVIGAVVAKLDGGATSTVEADLVVEASGRGSAASSWFKHTGLHSTIQTVVANTFGSYASRLLRVPRMRGPVMRFAAQLPMPGFTKGAIVYPQDSGYYVVSLFGRSHDYPPSDEEGFDAFLQGSAVPTMHTVVHAPKRSLRSGPPGPRPSRNIAISILPFLKRLPPCSGAASSRHRRRYTYVPRSW